MVTTTMEISKGEEPGSIAGLFFLLNQHLHYLDDPLPLLGCDFSPARARYHSSNSIQQQFQVATCLKQTGIGNR
jgi:hypothetical protein